MTMQEPKKLPDFSLKRIKLVMLGLDDAGKTTLVYSLGNDDIRTVRPTQGYNLLDFDTQKYTFNMHELGGHRDLRQYWRIYTPTEILVWMVDCAYEERIQESVHEFHEALKIFPNCPILLVCSKTDLPCLAEKQMIDLFKLTQIKDRQWKVVSISCYLKEGLHPFVNTLEALAATIES